MSNGRSTEGSDAGDLCLGVGGIREIIEAELHHVTFSWNFSVYI